MSRVTSISENEMNMFKIPFKCRALQRAIGMFISFSENPGLRFPGLRFPGLRLPGLRFPGLRFPGLRS